MPPLEIRFAVLRLNRSQFTLQDWVRKLPLPHAGSRKRESIRSVSLYNNEVKHLSNKPPGREYFAVIYNPFFQSDQIHCLTVIIPIISILRLPMD